LYINKVVRPNDEEKNYKIQHSSDFNHDLIYNEVKCDFITVCWLEKALPDTINGYFTCIQNIVDRPCEQGRPWDVIMRYAESDYTCLMPLFEYLFCVPCVCIN
jgi:hypothetical protein